MGTFRFDRGHKFRAKSLRVDGMFFASQREFARWNELRLLEKSGAIHDLRRQVRIPVYGANNVQVCVYVADAVYVENGKEVIEDVKGFATREYVLKRKLLAAMGIEIQEI